MTKVCERMSLRSVFMRRIRVTVAFLTLVTVRAAAQEQSLQADPQHTTVTFTLSDVLHTVRGTFQLKRGTLRLDPASGKLAGEVVVDRKMNREVLESDRYPEIAFRPDRVDGTVALQGKSIVRVHGMFNIHGSDHELTVPADVQIFSDHWTATLHFTVPYASWGMKNPSTLFLKVAESVDIDMNVAGNVSRPRL